MNEGLWWAVDIGQEERWQRVLAYVRALETNQQAMTNRIIRYAWLYDRNCRLMGTHGKIQSLPAGDPFTENIIRNNVETATALLGNDQTRLAALTDGAEWSVQRRAKGLERFLEAQFSRLNIDEDWV